MDVIPAQTTIQSLQQAGLEPMHFFLAYAGMILCLLARMGEEYPLPDFVLKTFFKRKVISIIFSIIGIPVILIVATDSSIHEFLPINYVTAVLGGWQTQALFKSVFAMYGNRKGLNNGSASSNGICN